MQALHAARMGHSTQLWARDADTVYSINTVHTNAMLEGHALPESLCATLDLAAVVEHSELLLLVVPSPYIESVLAPVAQLLSPRHIVVSCSKGILQDSLETVDEVLLRLLPAALHSRLAYLSGPSFAAEVADGKPTCVTVASEVGLQCGLGQVLVGSAAHGFQELQRPE